MKRTPTIGQLIAVVDAFNKAHELDIQDKRGHAKPNPMMQHLYAAATNAAAALSPAMIVEIKVKPARPEPPQAEL